MKRLLPLFLPLLLIPALSFAQGYYLDTTVVFPSQYFTTKAIPVALALDREDIASIGMGRTHSASDDMHHGSLANPASLATARTAVDLLNVQAGLPGRTLSAVSFVTDNQKQFAEGTFLKEIRAGIVDFNNATTPDQLLAAIRRINGGLKFVSDLVNDVSGGEENPMTHGLRVVPALQAQIGNFGFSLYGTAQTGFQVSSGQALDQFKNFKVPEDLSDPVAVAQAVQTLLLSVSALFDANGDIAPDALPTVYALSYIDIIGTAGYGLHVIENVDAGVTLKVVNRRFSTSRIPAQNLNNLLSETRSNFNASATGFTVDLGALYTVPSTGTRIAVTAENVLPVKTIQSDIAVDVVETFPVYARQYYPDGPIKTRGLDTGLVAVRVPIEVTFPFELQAPFILTLGAQHNLSPDWTVAGEWTDIAEKSSLFDNTMQRIRLGTEYRMKVLGGSLGLAGRLGFAQSHMTYGLGLELFRYVRLDGAIAYDRFTNAESYYAQLRVGW